MVQNRSELVGGDRALGEVGDFLLENDRIRLVIQGADYSRGFGVYGGSLIDADLRRPDERGTSGAGLGNDQFAELFPAFFVQAVDVRSVAVTASGKDGGPARIEAVGEAGDFLEILAVLNRAVTGSNADYQALSSTPRLRYRSVYELSPGHRYVTLRFSVTNISSDTLRFPGEDAVRLLSVLGLPTEGFTVPVGDVALFGATSEVFLPGIGFDLRFGLEEAYQRRIDFPGFPGLVVEWIAARANGVSYGLLAGPSPRNYVAGKRELYEDGKVPIDESSLLVPFAASGFMGVFHDAAPPELGPGQQFEATRYFIVGSGDVGSVLDVVHEIRKTRVGRLGGRVVDDTTGAPSDGTSVLVHQRFATGERRIYAQYDVRDGGVFGGTLPPGSYSLRIAGEGRPLSAWFDFTITEGQTTPVLLSSTPPGRVLVHVVDDHGRPLPAKATAVGVYGSEFSGELTRRFLFDLQSGESFRSSDLVDDDPNRPETRRYIESTAFSDDGVAELLVRPGAYTILSSRGPEYDVQAAEISVGPDEVRTVTHALRRVVDTRGWVAGDMHVHSRQSIDSPMTLEERVRSIAAEGVEWAVATDHNFITDYAPFVASSGLLPWLHPMVGLELTTLEAGHFNGYPLGYEVGPVTHGSFAWANRPPATLFADLRSRGLLGPENTLVQVNHPRDGVLGYFQQFRRDPFGVGELPAGLAQVIASPKGPAFRTPDGQSTFSLDFDAIEVCNGKLYNQIHHYRVPSVLPRGELPSPVPPEGTVVRKVTGEPAFAGAVEDWWNLLNQGRRTIAVGTGDSHESDDEAGQFRTMVYVGEDDPAALTDRRLVDALRTRRVVVTNGPLLEFSVDDPVRGVMGSTIVTSAPSVRIDLRLQAAPWSSISHVNVWRNGTLAKIVPVDPGRDLAVDPLVGSVDVELAKDSAGRPIDSWFLLEAIGEKNLFPVVRPREVPPVLLTDAVASLAGPLGIGADEFGALRPPDSFPVTPYVITNPVWVTTGEHPFAAPGLVPAEILVAPDNDPKMFDYVYPRSTVRAEVSRPMRLESRRTDRLELRGRTSLFSPRADNPFDVRKALSRFGHPLGHGH